MTSRGSTAAAVLVTISCGNYTDSGGEPSTVGSTGSSSTGSNSTKGTGGATTGAGGSAPAGSATGVATPDDTTAGGSAGASPAGSGGGEPSTGGTATAAPPEASCDAPVQSCGGDVVGTWSVVSSCLVMSEELDVAGTALTCDDPPIVTESRFQASGTLTFGEEGTWEDDTTTTGEFEALLDLDCMMSATLISCERLSASFQGSFQATGECVDEESEQDVCRCGAAVDQHGAPGFVYPSPVLTGSYTASDLLTISFEAGASGVNALEYYYCVQGNFMTLTPVSDNPEAAGVLTGEVVLELQ